MHLLCGMNTRLLPSKHVQGGEKAGVAYSPIHPRIQKPMMLPTVHRLLRTACWAPQLVMLQQMRDK